MEFILIAVLFFLFVGLYMCNRGLKLCDMQKQILKAEGLYYKYNSNKAREYIDACKHELYTLQEKLNKEQILPDYTKYNELDKERKFYMGIIDKHCSFPILESLPSMFQMMFDWAKIDPVTYLSQENYDKIKEYINPKIKVDVEFFT